MKGLTQYLTEHQKTFSQSQKKNILEEVESWLSSEFWRMFDEWEDKDEMEETIDEYEDWFWDSLDNGEEQFEEFHETVCREAHVKLTYDEFNILLANELSNEISEIISNLCDKFRQKWEDNYE